MRPLIQISWRISCVDIVIENNRKYNENPTFPIKEPQ
jgi:hypothetical protein